MADVEECGVTDGVIQIGLEDATLQSGCQLTRHLHTVLEYCHWEATRGITRQPQSERNSTFSTLKDSEEYLVLEHVSLSKNNFDKTHLNEV